MKKLNRINLINKRFIRTIFCTVLVLASFSFISLAEEQAQTENPPAEATTTPPAEAVSPATQPTQETKAEPVQQQKNMTPEELLNQPISLDLRNIDILEALKYLANKGNLNIVSTKNVSGRVTHLNALGNSHCVVSVATLDRSGK